MLGTYSCFCAQGSLLARFWDPYEVLGIKSTLAAYKASTQLTIPLNRLWLLLPLFKQHHLFSRITKRECNSVKEKRPGSLCFSLCRRGGGVETEISTRKWNISAVFCLVKSPCRDLLTSLSIRYRQAAWVYTPSQAAVTYFLPLLDHLSLLCDLICREAWKQTPKEKFFQVSDSKTWRLEGTREIQVRTCYKNELRSQRNNGVRGRLRQTSIGRHLDSKWEKRAGVLVLL